jgi:hypothetical protein
MNFSMKAVRLTGLLFIISLFIVFSPFRSFGQGQNEGVVHERLLRVEIPVKSDNETYRLIPLAEYGVLLFYKSVESVDQGKVKWYFSLYDLDLKLVWTKGVALDNFLDYNNFSAKKDTLDMLFKSNGKEKINSNTCRILRLLVSKSLFIGVLQNLPDDAEIIDFQVARDNAYIGLNVKNKPSQLLKVDLNTGRQKFIILSPEEVSLLFGFMVDSIDGKVISAVKKPFIKNQSGFFLATFDSSGNKVSEIDVNSISGEHELKSIRFFPLTSEDIILIGTYGSYSGQKSSTKNRVAEESSGFYFTRILNSRQQSIIFYNFLELKDVNLLLGENEIESLRKKAQKKNKALNEYSIDLSLILHPIVMKDQYIGFLAESFIPQYHSENFTDFDFYGRPFTNTYSIFDGFRFKNAILVSFDKNGKLLWDHSMEIRNVVSFELSPKVCFFPSGNNDVMAYSSEGKIGSKIIHQSNTIEKLDFSPIELGYPNDKLLKETNNKIIPWYGNFFICYGYQEIKNVSLESNNKRLVFYFNKIRFD